MIGGEVFRPVARQTQILAVTRQHITSDIIITTNGAWTSFPGSGSGGFAPVTYSAAGGETARCVVNMQGSLVSGVAGVLYWRVLHTLPNANTEAIDAKIGISPTIPLVFYTLTAAGTHTFTVQYYMSNGTSWNHGFRPSQNLIGLQAIEGGSFEVEIRAAGA